MRPRISSGVFHEAGTYLNGEYHYWPDGHSGVIQGDGWVEKVFDRFPLMPGNYDLSVVLEDESGQHRFQHLDRTFRLPVRLGPDTEPFGFVVLEGPWRESPEGTFERRRNEATSG